jgi:hypothetical protein
VKTAAPAVIAAVLCSADSCRSTANTTRPGPLAAAVGLMIRTHAASLRTDQSHAGPVEHRMRRASRRIECLRGGRNRKRADGSAVLMDVDHVAGNREGAVLESPS